MPAPMPTMKNHKNTDNSDWNLSRKVSKAIVAFDGVSSRYKTRHDRMKDRLIGRNAGREGLLGIIMEITVKLLPVPENSQVMLTEFGDVQGAADAVADMVVRALHDFIDDNPPAYLAAKAKAQAEGLDWVQ